MGRVKQYARQHSK
jgi:hypothetical protein